MKVLGKTNFMLNESLGFVIESYDGSTDSQHPFPEGKTGRLVFRTDEQQIYICIADNPVIWKPLIKVSDTYTYTQSTVSNEWDITHNLGTDNILIQIYDNSGNKVFPDEIQIIDDNNIKVLFTPNVAGKALIVALDSNLGAFVTENKLSQDVLKSDQNITNVIYNSDDNPTEVHYGDGTVAYLAYVQDGQNGAGKVATIDFKNASNVTIEKWTYTYDSNDRLITATKTT